MNWEFDVAPSEFAAAVRNREDMMALALPPISLIRYDDATTKLVHDGLTSVIAGHPQAIETYTFYEEIDRWLGPWGDAGYPIAYGKFYNVAFTRNEKLMADPVTKEWVWKTTILLQEMLRDYIVQRMRDRTIGSITEAELRKAAFESHPRAYTDGGLTKVSLIAPELIPIIMIIPAKEFSPTSQNFGSTILQIFSTMNLTLPRIPGYVLPALAGPAHSGIFQIAARRDQQNMLMERRLASSLASLQQAVNSGKVDDISTLRSIVTGLNAKAFPNQGFARQARIVVQAAEARQQIIQEKYRSLLKQSPEVSRHFHERFGHLLRPAPK